MTGGLERRSAGLAAVVAVLALVVLSGAFLAVEGLTGHRPSPASLDRLEAQLDAAAFDGLEIPRDDRRTLDVVVVQFVDSTTGGVLVEARAGDLDVATLQGPTWRPAIERFLDGTADLSFAVRPDRGRAVLTTLLWGLPVVLLVAVGPTVVAIGRALRPVRRLRADLVAIGDRAAGAAVSLPGGDDELSALVHEADRMLRRLEAGEREHRRFVADVSHELRSPVAAIRTVTEVALTPPSAGSTRRALRLVAAEGARMEQLVGDLLDLARAAALPIARTTVHLDAVVRAEADRPRRLPVTHADLAAVRLPGDGRQLARLVGNLLDNAARHGATGVEVGLHLDAAEVALTVDDDGAGIAPDDRTRVFDRFVRLPAGHALDPHGSGLGLALVAAVVEQHGGLVAVRGSARGGARFEVRLPRLDVA